MRDPPTSGQAYVPHPQDFEGAPKPPKLGVEDAPITVSDDSMEGSLASGDHTAAEGTEVPRAEGRALWPTRLHAAEEKRRNEAERRKMEEEEQKKEMDDGGRVASPPCDLSVEGAPNSSPP